MTVVADDPIRDQRRQRFDRFVRATELPLAGLALLIVPALILEDRAQSLQIRDAAIAVNWFVWLAFCFEYATKLVLSPKRSEFVSSHWFDVLIIVVSPPFLVPQAFQGARTLRAARVTRLLRLLRFARAAGVAAMGLRMAGDVLSHRKFHYVALATGVIVALGAIGIYAVEHGTNDHISTIGDALWWSVVTVTTVGYGDVSPTTPEGRLIAVVLMILGIGFIGVFTATVTSFFFGQDQSRDADLLASRLDAIEAKLDAVLKMRRDL